MKKSFAGVLFCLAVLVGSLAGQEAAQGTQEGRTQVGIGIGLEPTRLFLTSSVSLSNAIVPVSIFVPIRFGSSFRFEPEFGMYRYSSSTSSGGSTSSSDGSVVRIGAGALFTLSSGENYNLYLGPRLGLYLVSEGSESGSGSGSSSTEESETDVTIGIAIGSEYFLTPHLSFGGEAQFNYVSFGDPERTYTPPPSFPVTTSDRTRSFIWSSAVFLFRWYF